MLCYLYDGSETGQGSRYSQANIIHQDRVHCCRIQGGIKMTEVRLRGQPQTHDSHHDAEDSERTWTWRAACHIYFHCLSAKCTVAADLHCAAVATYHGHHCRSITLIYPGPSGELCPWRNMGWEERKRNRDRWQEGGWPGGRMPCLGKKRKTTKTKIFFRTVT